MLNLDVQDKLTNGKIGVAKHLEIVENKVSTTSIKSDDLDPVKKLIMKNNIARINNWAPIKKNETSIIITNTNKLVAIKRLHFLLRWLWACTIHKVCRKQLLV